MIAKELIVIATLLITETVHASCEARADTLIRMKVYECQGIEVEADKSKGQALGSSKARGVLVSGVVSEVHSVKRRALWANIKLPEGPAFKASGRAQLFLAGDVEEVCGEAYSKQQQWFITKEPCCDVLPHSGICLVPDAFPVAQFEPNPEDLSKNELIPDVPEGTLLVDPCDPEYEFLKRYCTDTPEQD